VRIENALAFHAHHADNAKNHCPLSRNVPADVPIATADRFSLTQNALNE
jgi:hypothetical protein